jgi:hypothetical protein
MAERDSPGPRANRDLHDQLPTATFLLHDSDGAPAAGTHVDLPPHSIEHNTHGPVLLAHLQNARNWLTGWDFHARQRGVAFA